MIVTVFILYVWMTDNVPCLDGIQVNDNASLTICNDTIEFRSRKGKITVVRAHRKRTESYDSYS